MGVSSLTELLAVHLSQLLDGDPQSSLTTRLISEVASLRIASRLDFISVFEIEKWLVYTDLLILS